MLELEIDSVANQDNILNIPLAHEVPIRSFHWSKRAFDILFSLIILTFGLPIYLLIFFGIKLSSPGSAFFVQNRLGKNGKVFKCFKFRTMVENAEDLLPLILKTHPQLKQEWEKYQKLKNDPRILPIGQFLRKCSFDELPQFWNVLKGDLSVVGPRPYIVEQKTLLGAKEKKILSIRPGITGIWQTSARNHQSFSTRIELDEEYIEKQSFLYDLVLIAKTIPIIFFSKNGY